MGNDSLIDTSTDHLGKRLSADDRRASTVEPVIERATGQNPGEITTAAITARMQLTQDALFRHFPDKEAIWKTVMERVADRLLTRIERAASGATSPLAALEAMYLAHIAFVIEHPGVPRILLSELQRAADSPAKRIVQTIPRRYSERLRTLIEGGKASGELDPQLDAAAAATLFIGSIHGVVMHALLLGDSKKMRREASRVFVIYRRGIHREQSAVSARKTATRPLDLGHCRGRHRIRCADHPRSRRGPVRRRADRCVTTTVDQTTQPTQERGR